MGRKICNVRESKNASNRYRRKGTRNTITRKLIGKQSLEPIDRFWLGIKAPCVGSFYAKAAYRYTSVIMYGEESETQWKSGLKRWTKRVLHYSLAIEALACR